MCDGALWNVRRIASFQMPIGFINSHFFANLMLLIDSQHIKAPKKVVCRIQHHSCNAPGWANEHTLTNRQWHKHARTHTHTNTHKHTHTHRRTILRMTNLKDVTSGNEYEWSLLNRKWQAMTSTSSYEPRQTPMGIEKSRYASSKEYSVSLHGRRSTRCFLCFLFLGVVQMCLISFCRRT